MAVVVVGSGEQTDVGIKKYHFTIIDANETVFEVDTTGADRFDLAAF